MRNIKKFNEIYENASNDVFSKDNYKDTTIIVNISSIKEDFLKELKKWCDANNFIPEKKSVELMLEEYYYYVLHVDNDLLYEFLQNDDVGEDDREYDEWFPLFLKKIKDEKYLKFEKTQDFNL